MDSAGTLMGVALVIVTGVHLGGKASTSIADEMAFASAVLFLGSCGASHRAISKNDEWYEVVLADRLFAAGLLVLLGGVFSLWF
jgi:dienelactone hydrolase